MLSATFQPLKEMFSYGLPSSGGQAQETHLQPTQLPPLFEEPSLAPFQPLPSLDLLPQGHVSGFFGVDLSPPLVDASNDPQLAHVKEPVFVTTPNVASDDDTLPRSVSNTFSRSGSNHTNLLSSAPTVSPTSVAPSESGSVADAQATIHDLENTVESMSLRIKELENMVRAQQQSRTRSNSSGSSSESEVVNVAPNTVAETAKAFDQVPSLENTESTLDLVGEMENQWYCDRPYPVLRFQLVDKLTKIALTPASKFKVQVSLLDGYGKRCDELGGAASAHGFVFESDKAGVVDVSNIRFTQVSSKMGGHFTLVVQTLPNKHMKTSCEFQSSRVTILSYRLFNARKLDFNRLSTKDPLSKVKGIGSMYAKRFATLGIHTIEHLSLLRTNDDLVENRTDGVSCCQVIENLRKVRGALTHQKLEEYVLQAREVMERECNDPCRPTQAYEGQPKRDKKRGRATELQQKEVFDFDSQILSRRKRHCRKQSTHPDRQAQASIVDTPF